LGNWLKIEVLVAVCLIPLFIVPAFAESNIPTWVKNTAGWWADDLISDNEFVSGIQWLMENGLLSTNPIPDEFPSHLKTDSKNWADGKISDNEYLLILEEWISNSKSEPTFDDKPISIQRNESNTKLPEWIRNVFVWYADGKVSENELLNSIKYLVQEKIIVLDESSSIDKLTCDALYDDLINLVVSNTVFSKIASDMLKIAIMYPELLPDEQLTESIWAETGKTLKANQERVQDITETMELRQCSLSYEQTNMMKFLIGYLTDEQ